MRKALATAEAPLGDLLDLIVDHRGKTPKKLGGDFTSHGIPVVSAVNVKGGRVVPSGQPRFVSEDLYQRWMPAKLRASDVLLTSEAPLGEVARVQSDAPIVIGQRLFGLRGRAGVLDNGYLFYALQWRPVLDQLLSRATGTTVTGIRQSELLRVTLQVPPFARQRAIAAVLGVLDEKIDVERRVAELSLLLAEAAYRAEVEASGRTILLRDAGRWLSGGTPSTTRSDYWNGDTPWISSSSLRTFFLSASERMVTERGVQNGTRVVPAGSVLFVVRGMSLKNEFRVGVAQRDVAFGQDTKAIIPGPDVGSATLGTALFASRGEVLTLVDEAGHGTGRLPTDRIERLAIALPRPEREQIVEQTLSALIGRGAAAELEIRTVGALRDSLLPSLMSGEIGVRDADDAIGAQR